LNWLAATRPDSAIAKFIEKRGEGLHHLAFEAEAIEQTKCKLVEREGWFILLAEMRLCQVRTTKNVAFIASLKQPTMC
jgi:hypothetical protein